MSYAYSSSKTHPGVSDSHHRSGDEATMAKPGDSESTSVLRELLAATALQNKILTASFGTESGVADKRNGQSFYIDVGVKINQVDPAGAGLVSLIPKVLVNTSRIAELVSPSLGDVDVAYRIGIDSFSLHYWSKPANLFPITISCPFLQAPSGSRYFSQIIGDGGSALSGTAATIIYGELPSSLEFSFGYMNPIPVDQSGVLDTTLWPLLFNDNWLAREVVESVAGRSRFPTVRTTAPLDVPLWGSANIYALTVRLYVIPSITPRVRVVQPP